MRERERERKREREKNRLPVQQKEDPVSSKSASNAAQAHPLFHSGCLLGPEVRAFQSNRSAVQD
jgi:hypothetical protein